jgi:hypothetical protein
VKAIKDEEAAKLVPARGPMLVFITQDDVIHRRVFDPEAPQLRAELRLPTSKPRSRAR